MAKFYVLLIFIFGSNLLFGQNNDVFVKDVDFVVDASLSLSGSFYDESDGGLLLRSELCFKNTGFNNLVFSSVSDVVNGRLCFKGGADSHLQVDGASFQSLEMNMAGSDLYLSGDLSLSDRLSLFSGRVLSDGIASVLLANSSESSLIYNNVKDNVSYLGVTLKRAVSAGGEYAYPVGDVDSYHPVYISSLSADDQVAVSYSSDFDEDWLAVSNYSDFKFPSSDAWHMEDDGFGVAYEVSLSKLNASGEIVVDKLAALYVADPLDSESSPFIDRVLNEESDYMLHSEQKHGSGLYALVESDFGLTADKQDIELVNIIVADKTTQSYFVIPEMKQYQRVSIRVYDSWGRVVFSSENYNGEFNTRSYPNGTYYYHMVATLLDGKEIVKDDILEVVRAE